MQLFDPYLKLQGQLRRYEEHGWLIPNPESARLRFLAFAEIELIPLTRRLTAVLQQAGIPAQTVVQLDETPMWFGVFLDETWTRGLHLQPHDSSSLQLTVRLSLDPPLEEPHVLAYRHCTREKCASALERCIDHLLTRPPL